jgi:tRNA dimethylallyltransferase
MPSAGDLVVIEGPTGIGKTALGVALAEAFRGEVVSADSRQIYRRMNIGTAKPTPDERARVPHHLIDIVDPNTPFSLTEYQQQAYAVIDLVRERDRLPLLVGGTGQYITAVLEGWQAPEVPPDPALRAELASVAEQQGSQALYTRLVALDPGAVGLIDPRNIRRVIRALEVSLRSGAPFSQQRRRSPPPFRSMTLALTMDRAALDIRSDARIDRMMASGLLDEVRALAEAGYDWHLPSMSGLGYAQLGAFLRGECTLEVAVADFKRATRLFIRRQYTWFRQHGSPRWVDTSQVTVQQIIGWVREWRGGPLVPTSA